MRIFVPIILVSLLSSCRDPQEDDTSHPVASLTLAERADCTSQPSPFTSVALSETDISTVPQLEWTSDEPVAPILVLDTGDGPLRETTAEEDPTQEGLFWVMGTPYHRSASTLLAVDTENGRVCSETFSFETGALDQTLPELTLSHYDPEHAEGGYTVAHLITESEGYVVILDELGQYIWTYAAGHGGIARVVAGLDRQSVLHLNWANNINEPGSITRLSLDGTVLEDIEIPTIHTDFVELPNGGFASLGWEIQEFTDDEGDVRSLVGDTLVVYSPDGTTEILWSSFEQFDPDLSSDYSMDGFAGPDLEDWSHANGLDYDPDEDAYFITVAGLDTVVRVDGQTGNQVWALNSLGGDFSQNTSGTVQGPHSVEHLGNDRILLFNRNLSQSGELPDESERCSEANELQLNPDKGSVEKLWSYGSEECLWILYFGEARRLEGGNTMVIFSSAGQIDEATPEGETVWRVNTDVGGAFGFGDRVSGFQLDSAPSP